MMGSLAIGFPLYHQVSASFFARWLDMDHRELAATVTVNGAYILDSMTTIVEKALTVDGWTRLVILEHDMIVPADALNRIARYASEQAIVGSVYFGHPPPHNAIIYIEQPDGGFEPITADTVRTWCDDPALYRCSAVGFGFTSIAREVLEDWPDDVPMFATSETIGSHDIWFCKRARELGHQVYVDTGIVCDHLTEVPIRLSNNQDCAHMVDSDRIREFEPC